MAQVTRFGAELVLAREVTALEARGPADRGSRQATQATEGIDSTLPGSCAS